MLELFRTEREGLDKDAKALEDRASKLSTEQRKAQGRPVKLGGFKRNADVRHATGAAEVSRLQIIDCLQLNLWVLRVPSLDT